MVCTDNKDHTHQSQGPQSMPQGRPKPPQKGQPKQHPSATEMLPDNEKTFLDFLGLGRGRTAEERCPRLEAPPTGSRPSSRPPSRCPDLQASQSASQRIWTCRLFNHRWLHQKVSDNPPPFLPNGRIRRDGCPRPGRV